MYIYKITNLINNKIYIGQTTQKRPTDRWHQHKSEVKRNKKSKQVIHKAMLKYGIENFLFEIIDTAINYEELDNKEMMWITKLKSTNKLFGYNIEVGGSKRISNENKEKYSKLRSEITRKYYSNKENREKLSRSQKERFKNNKELSKNISERQKKAALEGTNSITKRGTEHPFSKNILQITFNGIILKIFHSGFEAERETNISQAHINKCCLNKYYQAGGFFWIYEDEYSKDKITELQKKYSKKHEYCSNKIYIYTKNKELLKEFRSQKEAAVFLNITPQFLSNRLKKNKNYYKEFYITKNNI